MSFQRVQGKGVPHIPIKLRTRQINTLDPAVQQHFEWLSFQLADVFLVIFILDMDRKPNAVEFFILMARLVLSKGGKTKNSGISDNNHNARICKLYKYKEMCTEKSERKGLSYCQVHLNPASIRTLAHLSVFSYWKSRVQTMAAMSARECTENTSPILHTRTFSCCARSHTRRDHTFGSMARRFVCVPQKSFHHWSCLRWMFCRPHFFLLSHYCLTNTTYCLFYATDWNLITLVCNSALVWLVWPSGWSDPKYRSWAQVLHRCR